MEIFEKIGDAASKTYKFTAEKTSKIAKETKIRMEINEHKSDIKDIYQEIGEAVYQKYVKDEDLDMKYLEDKCKEIQELSDKIVACKDEILTLKEKRQCKNCYEEIEINANYCPNCGYEQEPIKKEEESEANGKVNPKDIDSKDSEQVEELERVQDSNEEIEENNDEEN